MTHHRAAQTSHGEWSDGRRGMFDDEHRGLALSNDETMRAIGADVPASQSIARAFRKKLLRAQGVASIFAINSTTRANEGIE